MKTAISYLAVLLAATVAACSVVPERFAVADVPGRDAQIVAGHDAAVKKVAEAVERQLRTWASGLGTCKIEVNNVPNPETFERSIRTNCFGSVNFDNAVMTAMREANDLSVPRYRLIVSTPQYRGALNWYTKAGRMTIAYVTDVPKNAPIAYAEPGYNKEAYLARSQSAVTMQARWMEPDDVLPPASSHMQQAENRAGQGGDESDLDRANDALSITTGNARTSEKASSPLAGIVTQPYSTGPSPSNPVRGSWSLQPPQIPLQLPPQEVGFGEWIKNHGAGGWTIVLTAGQEPPSQVELRSFLPTDKLLVGRHAGPAIAPYVMMLKPRESEAAAQAEYQRVVGAKSGLVPHAYRVSELWNVGVR